MADTTQVSFRVKNLRAALTVTLARVELDIAELETTTKTLMDHTITVKGLFRKSSQRKLLDWHEYLLNEAMRGGMAALEWAISIKSLDRDFLTPNWPLINQELIRYAHSKKLRTYINELADEIRPFSENTKLLLPLTWQMKCILIDIKKTENKRETSTPPQGTQ